MFFGQKLVRVGLQETNNFFLGLIDRWSLLTDDHVKRLTAFSFVCQVISGNLKFEVGLLQYAGERPSIVLAGALGGAAAILVIIVVILIVFMWRKQKGPFKKKAPIENSVRYNAPTGVIQNANATENTFNMNAGANGMNASLDIALDSLIYPIFIFGVALFL